MPAVLNTNMASLYAQKSLSTAQADLAGSVQKLSSGKRINSAKDDAAGYAVAEAVKATKNVTDQSIQNTQDAISMVQTAEGALDVVSKMLQRVLTLVTEKDNGSLTNAQTSSINSEIKTLLDEVSSIKSRTKFQGGGSSLFGSGDKSFATGDATTTTVNIADLTLSSLFANSAAGSSATFATSAGVVTGAITTTAAHGFSTGDQLIYKSIVAANEPVNMDANSIYYAVVVDATHIKLATSYDNAMAASPVTITPVATTGTSETDTLYKVNSSSLMAAVQTNIANRADLGSIQNRLNYIVDNMQTLSNNLADAESRIVDTNYAAETANLTRGQILQQAATSMLAQANQMPNVILTLLK